jgi:hypothetical protein
LRKEVLIDIPMRRSSYKRSYIRRPLLLVRKSLIITPLGRTLKPTERREEARVIIRAKIGAKEALSEQTAGQAAGQVGKACVVSKKKIVENQILLSK